MALIDEIRKKFEADQFEFSKHAVDQSIIRRISVQEVRESFANVEVIEDYPEDKYGPSCLIFGEDNDRAAPVYPMQLPITASNEDYYALRARSGTLD
jgi:hypothetical protein